MLGKTEGIYPSQEESDHFYACWVTCYSMAILGNVLVLLTIFWQLYKN